MDLHAFIDLVLAPAAMIIGVIIGRRTKKQEPTWLVRPHTDKTLQDFPVDDGVDHATVKEAVWVDTGHRGSGSKME